MIKKIKNYIQSKIKHKVQPDEIELIKPSSILIYHYINYEYMYRFITGDQQCTSDIINYVLSNYGYNIKCLKLSNILILLHINHNNMKDLCEFLSSFNGTSEITSIDGINYKVLLGGSLFDYIELLKDFNNTNNTVRNLIINNMYELPYSFFNCLIEKRIMIKNDFITYNFNDINKTGLLLDYFEFYDNENIKEFKSSLYKFSKVMISNHRFSIDSYIQFIDTIKCDCNTVWINYKEIKYFINPLEFTNKTIDGEIMHLGGMDFSLMSMGALFLDSAIKATGCFNYDIKYSRSLLPLNSNTTYILSTDLINIVKLYNIYDNNKYTDEFKALVNLIVNDIITLFDNHNLSYYEIIDKIKISKDELQSLNNDLDDTCEVLNEEIID